MPAMKAFENFVNGKRVEAADGRTTDVVDPTTGRAYATAPLSGPADVDAAMQAAADAFEGWRDATPAERSLALFRIADAVEAHGEELIALEVENTGKPIGLTRSEEIPPMVDQIRFFATAARHLEGKGAAEYMAGHTSFVRREPVGVCAQVAPWNYPMMMAVWKFAPAIAAGNAVVLKPSDTTPASTTLLAEIAAEFLPPGVFNVICGDRDTGRAMVEHPTPAMVSITGSVRAGMEVAGAAAAGPQAGPPRARRQGAGRRVRRRRHRRRRRGHRDGRLLQRRAGLHGGDPGARRARHLRRLRRRAGRGGRGPSRPGCPTTTDVLFGPVNNADQLARVAGFVDRVPGPRRACSPAAHARARPATSTSRPSSPTCGRTTR